MMKCPHCKQPTVYEIRPERHRCIICGRSEWMEFKMVKPMNTKGAGR